MAAPGGGIGSMTLETVSYNGALYLCLAPSAGLASVGSWNVWRSNDNGATWSAIDTANAPGFPGGKQCFDGVNTIWVVYFEVPTIPTIMRVRSFNLITQTWSAEVATGPATFAVSLIAARADGSLIVVYQNDGTVPGGDIYLSAGYLAGVWSAPEILHQNFVQAISNGSPDGILDPATDTLHVFWSSTLPGILNNALYQAILSNNTYGTFRTFSSVDTPEFPSLNIIGRPCIFNGDIFVPLILCSDPTDPSTYRAGGYIGSPAIAPVWSEVATLNGLALNINYPAVAGNDGAPPVATTDGTTVYVVYMVPSASSTFASGRICLCISTDLINWSGSTEYDIDNDAGFQRAGSQVITDPIYSPGIGVTIAALDPTLVHVQRFFLSFSVIPQVVVLGHLLDARAYPVLALPGGDYLDTTGASRACFPIRIKPEC